MTDQEYAELVACADWEILLEEAIQLNDGAYHIELPAAVYRMSEERQEAFRTELLGHLQYCDDCGWLYPVDELSDTEQGRLCWACDHGDVGE